MFVKVTNGQAQANYTIGDLRKDNPSVSFPRSVPDETLAAYNVFRVTEVPAPDHDSRTHRLVTQAPTLIDGVWTVTRVAVAKEQAQIDREDAEAAANAREDRNRLLADSDWTQVADAPVDKAVWATYRQALRDVTVQVGFPYSVTWPVKPE